MCLVDTWAHVTERTERFHPQGKTFLVTFTCLHCTISYFPRFVFYMTIQKFWIHHVDGYIPETPNSQGNACQFTCLICPLFVCLHVLIQLYFFVLHSWWHTHNVLQSYFHKNGKIFLDRQGLTTDQTRTENVGDIVVFISNTTMCNIVIVTAVLLLSYRVLPSVSKRHKDFFENQEKLLLN